MAMPQKIKSNQNEDSCNKNTLILLIDKWKQRPCKVSILILITENKKQMLNARNVWILATDRKMHQQNIPTLLHKTASRSPAS